MQHPPGEIRPPVVARPFLTSLRPCHPGKGKPCRTSNMLTPWEDEPDDARPNRKPYAHPACSYRVGALT